MSGPKATKTVIITGANSGLGFEAAKRVALSDPESHVVIAGRNKERIRKASAILNAEVGEGRFTPMQLDLGSLASVRQFAAELPGLGSACRLYMH
ncbi:hypothetical protein AWM70_03185 [Paenibacillus yonginensis]|uniref:Short-chain dehydrogenase n=1 Tax=Paenibacillus yonginensis TaxID=1462996 RepID=A0A1B1MX17_9BACL|nr:SDR family NAD(P)-dependent oxidoreductase [Paenibacillus yonginensis]ANS73699.1 hypothetical protein AWM70_03185 [Paenibacillus yonginensis]